MEAMTVAEWLLAQQKKRDIDALPSVQAAHDRNGFACDCPECIAEGRIRSEIHFAFIRAWFGPGMADLRAIAEADGQANGVSEEWLRRQRGRLVRDCHWSAAEVDALTIPEFVDVLRNRPGKGMGDGQPQSTKPNRKKPATVNERMAAELLWNSESLGWSRYQWAQKLGCSESAVQKTDTWDAIQNMRAGEKLRRHG